MAVRLSAAKSLKDCVDVGRKARPSPLGQCVWKLMGRYGNYQLIISCRSFSHLLKSCESEEGGGQHGTAFNRLPSVLETMS